MTSKCGWRSQCCIASARRKQNWKAELSSGMEVIQPFPGSIAANKKALYRLLPA